MPSTYAAVSTRMWSASLRRCNIEARLVRAYIATCPTRATEGLFPLALGYASADTGLDHKTIQAALVQLEEAGIIGWDAQRELVLDLEALEVANIRREDDNRIRGAITQLRGLGDTPLKAAFMKNADIHSPVLARAIREQAPEVVRGFDVAQEPWSTGNPALN